MGPVLILVSASCFGAMAIFGKHAYAAGVPAPTLVLLRFAVASAILVTAVALVRLRSGRPALPVAAGESRRRLVVTALALGGVGYAAQASFYFASLERIDAALVALVLYTFPVLVTLASLTLGRDRLTPARVAALLAATGGTALVLVGAGALSFDTAGVTLAFAAALTYTVYILVGESTVQQVPALTLTALVMVGATLTLALRAMLTGRPQPRPHPRWLGLDRLPSRCSALASCSRPCCSSSSVVVLSSTSRSPSSTPTPTPGPGRTTRTGRPHAPEATVAVMTHSTQQCPDLCTVSCGRHRRDSGSRPRSFADLGQCPDSRSCTEPRPSQSWSHDRRDSSV